MSDVLITPASSKIEFKDASSNIDGTVKLDSDGNLELTSGNGISFGDVTSDVFIGNGSDNVDLKFEADGSITGTSGVTLTLGSSNSNVKIASNELSINATSGVITATTFSGNLNGTLTVVDESTDTTCFPLFVTSSTGNLAPKAGTNLSFNSSSGRLTATQLQTNGNILAYGDIVGDGATKITGINYLATGASTNDIVLKLKPGESTTNVGLGKSALKNITTDTDCIAIGERALINHTVGASHVTGQIAIGSSAMQAFTVVSVGGYSDGLPSGNGNGHNIAIGKEALQHNVRSNGNIAIGERALRNLNLNRISSSNANGYSNIGIGYEALRCSETTACRGSFNVAIGVKAGQVAEDACFNNTMVGSSAGQSITTGDNNLLLGYFAGTSSSPVTITTANNNIVLGNNSITDASIKVDWTVTSDKRDKTDIESFTHGLSWINKLNPVTYRWDMRSNYDDGLPDGSKKESKLNVGLIAQEELEVEKEHGYADTSDNMLISHINPGGSYGMQYSKLVPVLINAVKELSAKNDALEARIRALESGGS
tara:strand:+ start:1712 stop:3337 length:1626 start_codon:yes stop_codon:yes gene_type:complete